MVASDCANVPRILIGRTVRDNDTWIAATAAATNAVLLTTDKDFDPLG